MTIEREVFDDLVTLAEAGMASPATQKLLGECRARHPDWVAGASGPAELPRVDAPAGLEREALARTQKLLAQQRWLMFAGIALCTSPMTMVFSDRTRFVLYRDQPVVAAALYVLGLAVWAMFWWTNRRLTVAGLVRPAKKQGIRWGLVFGAVGVLMPGLIMLSAGTGQRFLWAWTGALLLVTLAAVDWAAHASRSTGRS